MDRSSYRHACRMAGPFRYAVTNQTAVRSTARCLHKNMSVYQTTPAG